MESWPASTAATTSTPVAGAGCGRGRRAAPRAASPPAPAPGGPRPRARARRPPARGRPVAGGVAACRPPARLRHAPRAHGTRVTRGCARGRGLVREARQVSRCRSRPESGAHPHGVPGAGDVEDRLGDAVGDAAPDQPQRVGAGLGEVAAQRDLGGLHRHRPAGAAAQVVEVDLAGEVGAGDRAARRRRRGGRSRGRRAARAGWRRTGRRRCARPPRSRSGCAAARAAATGRPRSAQQASCRPWVHTQNSRLRRSRRPGRRLGPRRAAPRGRGRARSAGSGTTAGLEPGPAGSAYAAKTRAGRRRRCGPGGAGPAGCGPGRGWRGPAGGLSPSGSRASRSASTPHGPGCSTSRNARTVEAVPATGSSRTQAGGRAAEVGLRRRLTRTTSSSPSRTRRRQSTSRLCGSRCRRGRRGSAPAGPGPPPARAQPGRHVQRAVAEQHLEAAVAVGTQHARVAGPAAQRVVSSQLAHGEARRTGRRRRRAVAAGEEPAYLGVGDRGVGVDRADPGGERLEPRRRGPRRAGRARRGSRRAGARRSTSASASRTPRSTSPRQVTWLMPMVTCSETVSWARAACGVPVGRYMLRPGSSSTSSTPSGVCTSHSLVPCGLEDEDVVGVGVHREALRRRAGSGRRWPGTGGRARARARRRGRLSGAPVAVQALEDDGGAGVERGRAPCRRRQPGERRPARVAPRVYDDSGSTEPSWASRTAGVRIAVRREQACRRRRARAARPGRSGSVRCRCTRDAQTFARKVWASPLSRSRAFRTRRRP